MTATMFPAPTTPRVSDYPPHVAPLAPYHTTPRALVVKGRGPDKDVPNRRQPWHPAEVQLLVSLRERGYSTRQVAQIMGRSHAAVRGAVGRIIKGDLRPL